MRLQHPHDLAVELIIGEERVGNTIWGMHDAQPAALEGALYGSLSHAARDPLYMFPHKIKERVALVYFFRREL